MPQVRMATFSQHHVDGLDLALTPLQYMLKCFPLTKDQEQRCARLRADTECHQNRVGLRLNPIIIACQMIYLLGLLASPQCLE